jgi:3-isopropylmalate/(R)-2-methylmalate dehydratase small subunit
LIECDTDWIIAGDEITIDLEKGEVSNERTAAKTRSAPIPRTMQTLLKDGGLIPHLKKHGGFALE